MTDRPMLEVVGHPVVVNPDKELRELAKERDWQVMEFANPVSLRNRLAELPAPDPVVTGAVAGILGAAIVFFAMRSRRRA